VLSATPRSLLFVPADDERKMQRAIQSPADAVILDLEDAVSPSSKPAALAKAIEVLSSRPPRPTLLVSINSPLSEFGAAELRALAGTPDLTIVVPKCEPRALAKCAIDAEIVALVETGRGVTLLEKIAAHPRVVAMQLGAEDLGAELGWVPRDDGLHLVYVRSRMVIESAVSGLLPPIDAVVTTWADPAAVRADALMARSLGFGGKACIHPAQLDLVNQAFTPTQAELQWAQSVIETHDQAASADVGVSSVGNQMIDVAVVRRAHRLLANTTPDPARP
jgi:citrate lyase beta subunit